MVRPVERDAPQIQQLDPTARSGVMIKTTSDDFYVTLPSNASTDELQANAPNHFTVRLPRPLHLPGEGWKVGLSSLSLPDTRV